MAVWFGSKTERGKVAIRMEAVEGTAVNTPRYGEIHVMGKFKKEKERKRKDNRDAPFDRSEENCYAEDGGELDRSNRMTDGCRNAP